MANMDPSQHQKYLHAVITMALLIELMDDLEGTDYYRFDIKRSALQFLKSVGPIVDHDLLMLCRKVDGKAITNLMIEHEAFMRTLANLYTSSFPIITAILNQYRDNPEFVLKQLDIEITVK